MFGVYQPMIGWKSKRIMNRHKLGLWQSKYSLIKKFTKSYRGISKMALDPNCEASRISIEIGKLFTSSVSESNFSILIQAIASSLPFDQPPSGEKWKDFIDPKLIQKLLDNTVSSHYKQYYSDRCLKINSQHMFKSIDRVSPIELERQKTKLYEDIKELINFESALSGALLGMVDLSMYDQLEFLFYTKPKTDLTVFNKYIADILRFTDPFETFDPQKDIKNVCVSPLGIVHLFRQYFFELDTFLGTPVGHVWLSPGSSVELIEVSTRRTYVEKIIEQSLETTKKEEKSITDRDEISDAVKQDNKTDLKLGATLTVNQSWGTGNATATTSLNMDKSQDIARETTHKRMREQTTKLSSEIKQNYKSTFKTITETTDTSSKRYVLNNNTHDLINYELRRKMRQVGVQVQDIGTYLCWQGYVDEPGNALGISNLVHIAKPADLVTVPDKTAIKVPDDQYVNFTAQLAWAFDDPKRAGFDYGFIVLGYADIPPAPDGFTLVIPPDGFVAASQISAVGEDFSGAWGFRGKIENSKITLGVVPVNGVMDWDKRVDFTVGGVLQFTASETKRQDIAAANAAKEASANAATEENARLTQEAYLKAVKDRIEVSRSINTRKYEDLREEERIIVYRKLIHDLTNGIAANAEDNETYHTVSELLNSIFDIDKMLYFVAPDWWKPRKHFNKPLEGRSNNYDIFQNQFKEWSDQDYREDNYYITDKSEYAKMGSSLGWLMQLDGDDLRNAFLNAPWVKTVMPIRPGKEREALNWLQQMHIEGTEGLDADYHAEKAELDKIKTALNVQNRKVSILDAIQYLCDQVAEKHKESNKVDKFPKEEINDDNKVNATPIDKVYEHGFYPLKDGFKVNMSENFEVFDQWIEILPTDQVVPVEVKYDPKTGRQK
ncbi:hypothetical protein MYP_1470 [Sporocytophaga myxococcoides]|uniref:Uncharacterized protein n=2 Tax=Sporocytophaga myxococcoides TaxID=153721 RepID=A0A098LCX6_9BACT|nr:hypothetical protein MYP_1470 [Sporocytophaga myxococcoides]